LDYNGYINVVRDQEETQFKKHVHVQNITMNRQELRRKHVQRMMSRDMVEKKLGMPHARAQSALDQFASAMGLTNGEELHSSVRENMRRSKSQASGEGAAIKLPAHERWQVQRKNTLDKRAISMIENRMQQEANELQLMEGWRAAARNSIRDKFVETRHRNTVVERHMDFLHTRDRLAPSMSSTNQLGEEDYEMDAGRDFSDSGPAASPSPDSMNETQQPGRPAPLDMPDTVQREQAVESPSGLSMTSGRKSPLPDIRLSPGEVEEEQYVLDSLDQIDDFSTSINSRQVKPSQRLRSLAIDSTKSWTRPMSRRD